MFRRRGRNHNGNDSPIAARRRLKALLKHQPLSQNGKTPSDVVVSDAGPPMIPEMMEDRPLLVEEDTPNLNTVRHQSLEHIEDHNLGFFDTPAPFGNMDNIKEEDQASTSVEQEVSKQKHELDFFNASDDADDVIFDEVKVEDDEEDETGTKEVDVVDDSSEYTEYTISSSETEWETVITYVSAQSQKSSEVTSSSSRSGGNSQKENQATTTSSASNNNSNKTSPTDNHQSASTSFWNNHRTEAAPQSSHNSTSFWGHNNNDHPILRSDSSPALRKQRDSNRQSGDFERAFVVRASSDSAAQPAPPTFYAIPSPTASNNSINRHTAPVAFADTLLVVAPVSPMLSQQQQSPPPMLDNFAFPSSQQAASSPTSAFSRAFVVAHSPPDPQVRQTSEEASRTSRSRRSTSKDPSKEHRRKEKKKSKSRGGDSRSTKEASSKHKKKVHKSSRHHHGDKAVDGKLSKKKKKSKTRARSTSRDDVREKKREDIAHDVALSKKVAQATKTSSKADQSSVAPTEPSSSSEDDPVLISMKGDPASTKDDRAAGDSQPSSRGRSKTKHVVDEGNSVSGHTRSSRKSKTPAKKLDKKSGSSKRGTSRDSRSRRGGGHGERHCERSTSTRRRKSRSKSATRRLVADDEMLLNKTQSARNSSRSPSPSKAKRSAMLRNSSRSPSPSKAKRPSTPTPGKRGLGDLQKMKGLSLKGATTSSKASIASCDTQSVQSEQSRTSTSSIKMHRLTRT